jgi:HEAT repeat protein
MVEAISKDAAPRVRSAAARALGRIGHSSPKAIAALQRAVDDSDAFVRGTAVIELGNLGPHAETATRSLRDALRDEDAIVRMGAAIALGRIGPAAAAAIDDLAPLLQEEDSIRFEAARAIARLSPGNPESVDVLLQVMKNRYAPRPPKLLVKSPKATRMWFLP